MTQNNGNQPASIYDMFGGIQNFNNQFNAFQQNMQNQGIKDPGSYAEQQIREGLQNGSISQEKFNQAAMIANMIMGRK